MYISMIYRTKLLMLFTICLLSLGAAKLTAQEIRANNPKEKKVLLLIAALPEVKERAAHIKRVSQGKNQITLMVSAEPELSIPYYQVNVNDNAPSYKNYYQFAVDPKTYEIFYYDAVKNRQYTLAEWRKIRKQQ